MQPKTEAMKRAIDLAVLGVSNGGPFGAVIVKDGRIIAEAHNQVTANNDPTAHAEIQAIRKACQVLGTFELTGCELYTSCEPCPMCLGAIYWSRPERVWYALTRKDAAQAGFDDDLIYREINVEPAKRKIPMHPFGAEEAKGIFKAWESKSDKVRY